MGQLETRRPHESRTVLVVEDEDDLADGIELVLSHAGYRTLRARDGVEALESAGHAEPDVVLLDLSMPRLDGFGVLRKWRTAHAGVPVIIMSAFRDFMQEAMQSGAAATLPKPFTAAKLLKTIQDVKRSTPEREHAAEATFAPMPCDMTLRAADAPSEVEVLASEEIERLQRITKLRVLSPERDAALDAIVELTTELLDVPIALVSIVTETRQWWKAMKGIGVPLSIERGTPRSQSFCTHAVEARAPLIVVNAVEHPIFKHNDLVRAGVLNAYAGVPIVIPEAGALGTLCAIDTKPRTFTAVDVEILSLLAARAAAEIEWRGRDESRPQGTFRYLTLVDERHGFYKTEAFTTFTGALARLALDRDRPFVLAGFRLGGGSQLDQRLDLLARALEQQTRSSDIVGWLDAETLAVCLNGADGDPNAIVTAVTQCYASLRGGKLDDSELRTACQVEDGAVTSAGVMRRLRAALRSGVAECALPPGESA